eukprot:7391965-Prymnesium_polylepis.1
MLGVERVPAVAHDCEAVADVAHHLRVLLLQVELHARFQQLVPDASLGRRLVGRRCLFDLVDSGAPQLVIRDREVDVAAIEEVSDGRVDLVLGLRVEHPSDSPGAELARARRGGHLLLARSRIAVLVRAFLRSLLLLVPTLRFELRPHLREELELPLRRASLRCAAHAEHVLSDQGGTGGARPAAELALDFWRVRVVGLVDDLDALPRRGVARWQLRDLSACGPLLQAEPRACSSEATRLRVGACACALGLIAPRRFLVHTAAAVRLATLEVGA